MNDTESAICIRPDVSVYATYRRLSYRPWYAIAEFDDNSTQNYYDHRTDLQEAYKSEGKPGRGSTFRFTLPVETVKDIEKRFKGVDIFRLEKEGSTDEEKNEVQSSS